MPAAPRRHLIPIVLGLGAFLSATVNASAQTARATAPHIVVIVAEGTGFPFEDPSFTKYPNLKRLRMSSRPFDSIFADDASWEKTTETILGRTRARGAFPLVAALKAQRYVASALSTAESPAGGFDRVLKVGAAEVAARVLESLDQASARSAFVFASIDLRSVPAGAPGATVEAPPLEVPAISLFDRGPLDPVRFPVTPPPREPADRNSLAARRHAAFSALDREIGALLKGLDQRGLSSKTVIALVSTGPAPRPERAAPSRPDLLFEDWLRGLALIHAPGLAELGVPASTLAMMSDLAPTLAALGGARMAKGDGVDLAAALKNPGQITRQSILSNASREAPRVGRSVRSQRFRFTQWPDGSEELFDEIADPREWKNLANVPSMQGQKSTLARLLTPPKAPAPKSPARPAKGRRPNVVMIIGDDLTAQYPQFADVKTPNLDRLRKRGRSYDKAYAPVPFCTASRAAFLSGLSPARLELQRENAFADIFTAQVPLIQEQFRANGYFTASVGKVWDSQPGEKRGWDINEWLPALLPGAVESAARLLPNLPIEAGPTANEDAAEGDGRRARLAVKILEEKRDQPLFLALGFVRPHPAWVAPQKYFDMYPPDQIKFTRAPAGDGSDIPGIAIKNRPQNLPGLMLLGREPGGFSDDPAQARTAIAAYLACITFMDAQLGLVLDALDRGDRWKDTVVILFGDNGHHFGDHGGLWRKNTLFEESLRVPMIIARPGMAQPGVSTSALADLIDVYPTLVDLTGISRPGTLDGVSLVPTIDDPKASVREAVVQYRATQPSKAGYSIRTARYRYTLWPDGSEELYDVNMDPAGRKDLAQQPAQAPVIASLRKQIEAMAP